MDPLEPFARELIDWNGRQLALRLQSLETEALYKEYLEREALAGLRRKRDVFGSEAEYLEALRAVTRDFADRVYAWGMPECQRSLDNLDNLKHFFWLALLQRQPDGSASPNNPLPREDVDRLWRDLDPGGGLPHPVLEAWQRLNLPNPKPPAASGRPAAPNPTATNSPPSPSTPACPSTSSPA